MKRDPERPASRGSSLSTLAVLDRLEVGRPILTPRRLKAPYRVKRGGQVETMELVYRYEDDVFEPDDEQSLNLASMIVAQVALNYGLFCREIRFLGFYDSHDRQFLQEMARNTAREVYVKKFLESNPFLRGPASALVPERRDSYLQARLGFPAEVWAGPGRGWQVDRARPAVLSSGGKDSLLSFGLLRELGAEPRAVFVNESGRHWYTALNAYRHFRDTVPGTARVWTNCDRLFTWMLRRLPFIRPDFADVRSDEYPVRLWTVAVFLFGALPLLKKQGLGRLYIGDEYDTTVRRRRFGIAHFDGLFDQSRYFDDALTRYFSLKGWGVEQLSLLRQLSELLVQKVLVQRYPELQQHQVSCHATHLDGELVRPCGRCEKCRRIVGMLLAADADPRRCGYDSAQVALCIEALGSQKLHQEAAGAEQLVFMLEQRGLLPAGGGRGRPRPEVLKLRFDPERSPLSVVPRELRRPLYRILGEHTAGALRRDGREWVEYDPLRDPESAGRERRPRPQAPETSALGPGPKDYVLGELSWLEAKERLAQTDLALLPVGAIEQHGPHLPLDVDAWDADYLARQVAAACSAPRPLVLPLISYGVSYHHEDFSGTFSIRPETLSRLVYEIGLDAARQGIKKLIIINGHGGNVPTLQFAAQTINRDAHIFTCVDTGDTSAADVAKLVETQNDVHAGEVETSTTLATRPELVKMEKARRFVPRFSSHYLDFSSGRSVEWYARTAKISPSGVLGDPTKATREKGERIWKATIDHLVAFVESLKGLTLDEIYERRY